MTTTAPLETSSMRGSPVNLDALEPVHASVGYGGLGRHGSLGYEGSTVHVGGREYRSALSTHPPARVEYVLPAGAAALTCQVAINDDVAGMGSYATFTVLADGRVVAEAADVRAGSAPVPIAASVDGSTTLELVVSTSAWAYCHAVWLDPVLTCGPGAVLPAPTVITDPLERADITVPAGLCPVERCIVTVASSGFAGWLDDLLGSLRANGRCPDARLVVFSLDGSSAVADVAARHGAVDVRCRPRRPLDPTTKAVVYSAGSIVPAERFVCLDADMLVLGDLNPLFGAIDACGPLTMLVCGEGNDHGIADLRSALDMAYGGGPDPPFLARHSTLGGHPLVVNDGLLAGSRAAFVALERRVRDLPSVVRWVDERADVRWRNQFAVNVGLVQGEVVELDPTWNVQLHVQDVEVDGGLARWRGRDVRILHFSGAGKLRHAGFRDLTRIASHLAALDDQGQFEQAISIGHELAERGTLAPAAAERMRWLESNMAPRVPGSTVLAERAWGSAISRDLLLQMQQGLHHQRYRGRQFVKSPFDLAMYVQLLEHQQPGTIIEIGSKQGGSALWLADTARALGIDCAVHSFDISPVADVSEAGVQFAFGDGRRLGDSVTPAMLSGWARPWLVVDDADHLEPTTSAILAFFHPHLQQGDIVVAEDGNLSDMYPELFPGFSSGPHEALRRFLAAHGDDYDIAADLCDLFGHNTTSATNGVLRRRPPPQRGDGSLDTQPWRAVQLAPEVLAVPTMLSVRERQVLHWLARYHVRGVGRIVDGGSFLGGSTVALASGLAARNDGEWRHAIASYDLFRVEEYTMDAFGDAFPVPRVGESFRSVFDANIATWANHVEVREGDASAIGWSGEPIEVLFLDMVKTWELNDLVCTQFLPWLIPGHSVIVQQDYLWGYGPWIHMTMELLDSCVRTLDSMPNGSVVYHVVDDVPAEVIGLRVRTDIPVHDQRILMDRAVSRWQGEERGMVELARAMLLAELDGADHARHELALVTNRYHRSERVRQCAAIVGSYLGA